MCMEIADYQLRLRQITLRGNRMHIYNLCNRVTIFFESTLTRKVVSEKGRWLFRRLSAFPFGEFVFASDKNAERHQSMSCCDGESRRGIFFTFDAFFLSFVSGKDQKIFSLCFLQYFKQS